MTSEKFKRTMDKVQKPGEKRKKGEIRLSKVKVNYDGTFTFRHNIRNNGKGKGCFGKPTD